MNFLIKNAIYRERNKILPIQWPNPILFFIRFLVDLFQLKSFLSASIIPNFCSQRLNWIFSLRLDVIRLFRICCTCIVVIPFCPIMEGSLCIYAHILHFPLSLLSWRTKMWDLLRRDCCCVKFLIRKWSCHQSLIEFWGKRNL